MDSTVAALCRQARGVRQEQLARAVLWEEMVVRVERGGQSAEPEAGAGLCVSSVMIWGCTRLQMSLSDGERDVERSECCHMLRGISNITDYRKTRWIMSHRISKAKSWNEEFD